MSALADKQQNEQETLLAELKKLPIIQYACKQTGISRATFYRWKNESKEFSAEVEVAMREGIELMNDLGESQLITLAKEKKFQAIKYWLTFRHPAYRQHAAHEDVQEKELVVHITDYGKDGDKTAA